MSSYQPFPISEFKTGIFSYLEPWIRPVDAFQPLENAYVYRGTLNKRPGYQFFGEMAYADTRVEIETGDGSIGPYMGTLSNIPVRAGSFTATDGTENFTDNGSGVLTGSAGGSGTLDYVEGDFSLTFNSAVSGGTPIYASYTYTGIGRPIMGIKTWLNSANDQTSLVIFDTRRAAIYNIGTGVFDPINTVMDYVNVGTGGVGPYNFNLGFANIVPGSFSLTDGTETFTSDTVTPIGNLTGSAGGTGTITWASGSVSVTFNAGTSSQFIESYTLAGDYFSGTFQNFFNTTNWNAPGSYGGTSHADCLYITNNVDRITLFDGTDLSRPNFYTNSDDQTAQTNSISSCLDLDVYKNRLLVQRPTIVGSNFPEGPSIRFSAVFNPTNLVANIAGNGGVEEAPTSDWIYASEFLRDQLVVFFKNSTWLFRFTGLTNQPFRWDRLNISKSTNSPYASVAYDERVTSVGSKGFIACDGVNVQRYDLNIIDQFLDIDQDFFNQCFSQRFDTNNQTWMLYPSLQENNGQSDKILVYNFLENTWSIYNIALSCLGLYNVVGDKTWADFPDTTWEQAEFSWNSYLLQNLAPSLMGGSHDGIVYTMDSGETDNGTSYNCDITSTIWNPFAKAGSLVQFGYIDIYYECNQDVELNITFYLNNSQLPGPTRTVEFKQTDVANPGQLNNWQRIYVNVSAQSLQMQITSSSEENFKILGMILWAKADGRLTPPKSFM